MMGIVQRIFSRSEHGLRLQPMSRLADATREQTRKELISMALRDTLKRYGFPAHCVAAEGVPGSSAGRSRGMHVQFVIRDCTPSFLPYAVAVQAAVRARLLRLDPFSASWVVGMSWRFEPVDTNQWPQLSAPRRVDASAPSGVVHSNPGRASFKDDFERSEVEHSALLARSGDFSPTLPMQHLPG